MRTPQIVKQSRQSLPPFVAGETVRGSAISLDVMPPSATPTDRPVSQLRGTRDYGMVLHQIRTLLMFACFCLAALVMVNVANGYAGRTPAGLTPVSDAVALQLLQPGPDPADDYYAHAVFADGSERDLQLGGYIVHNGLVRVELGVTAAAGSESACRIVIDGIRVTEERATDGSSTVCRWSAP